MIKFFKATLVVLISITSLTAQNLEKKWQFETIESESNESFFNVTEHDTLVLNQGKFSYTLKAKDDLKARGDYIHQNNLLLFFYNQPTDTLRYYRITELTETSLVFEENGTTYKFKPYKAAITTTDAIIPSQGFTMESLTRGAFGMLVLLLIAIALSKNRRAINWRTVGFGLTAQLVLAIGVLKVPFVQAAFELSLIHI